MWKYFLFIFLFSNFTTLAQDCETKMEYHENGVLAKKYTECNGVIQDTLLEYNEDGSIKSWYNFRDGGKDIISFMNTSEKGYSRKVLGHYIAEDNAMPINVGNWKWYWKNETLMDSVIYQEGKAVYTAHFSRRGDLEYEQYPEKIIYFNKKGKVKKVKMLEEE